MADTVAALSTGLVPSGVAIVRVSGPKARDAVAAVTGSVPQPRVAKLCSFRHPRSDALIDKGLVLLFPSPHSFTGEDVVEFHGHGSVAVLEALLEALWSLDGVEPAEAGDFTRQAFRNGKMDLSQVEALGDLVHASTSMQREQALQEMDGSVGRQVSQWREMIADCRALIEADLDFSDEDDVPGSVIDSLPERLDLLVALIDREIEDQTSERMRTGFRVVLAGPPNAGKSTLLNALVRRDVAIVSDIAGTTRDRIEIAIDLDGLPVLLSDTAGVRDIDQVDSLEAIGIERTAQAITEADCVVLLSETDEWPTVLDEFDPTKTIHVRSKIDVAPSGAVPPGWIGVGAMTGYGLSTLAQTIGTVLRDRYHMHHRSEGGTPSVASNARRRGALMTCGDHLRAAVDLLRTDQSRLEHAAEELRAAQVALGQIVGDVDSEAILDRVFARFCIGK